MGKRKTIEDMRAELEASPDGRAMLREIDARRVKWTKPEWYERQIQLAWEVLE